MPYATTPPRVRLELSLTPGIAVADVVVDEIDRDRNGVMSPDEPQAYARQVLGAMALRIDDNPLSPGQCAGARAP